MFSCIVIDETVRNATAILKTEENLRIMYEETMAEQISTGSTSFKFSKCFSGSTGFIGSTLRPVLEWLIV